MCTQERKRSACSMERRAYNPTIQILYLYFYLYRYKIFWKGKSEFWDFVRSSWFSSSSADGLNRLFIHKVSLLVWIDEVPFLLYFIIVAAFDIDKDKGILPYYPIPLILKSAFCKKVWHSFDSFDFYITRLDLAYAIKIKIPIDASAISAEWGSCPTPPSILNLYHVFFLKRSVTPFFACLLRLGW